MFYLENTIDQHEQMRHVYVGHSGPVYKAGFSFDNRFILSGSQDSTGNHFLLYFFFCWTFHSQ